MQSHSGQPVTHPLQSGQGHKVLNVTQWFQTVPKFRERVVENFFVSFEKIADRLKWPSEYWIILLHHVLVGKGLEVYN